MNNPLQNLGTLFVVVIAAWAMGARSAAERGPIAIDLSSPGDALVISLQGKPVGGLRVDEHGRLGIDGPNETSTATTVDALDRVQIDPAPVASPPTRLTVADDVWLTGVLRVGRADAFGDAPFDPNGAIQLGRNLPQAQPMSLVRFFAQGSEAFRLGATKDGCGFWSDGAHDTPLVTFCPSQQGESRSGTVQLYDAQLSNRDGTVRGRHPASGRSVDVVPR